MNRIAAQLKDTPLLQHYGGPIPVYFADGGEQNYTSVLPLYRIELEFTVPPDIAAGRVVTVKIRHSERLGGQLWKLILSALMWAQLPRNDSDNEYEIAFLSALEMIVDLKIQNVNFSESQIINGCKIISEKLQPEMESQKMFQILPKLLLRTIKADEKFDELRDLVCNCMKYPELRHILDGFNRKEDMLLFSKKKLRTYP